jgi:ATP-dependent Clp endopeptidase proteolytic subunit ClpP
LNPTNETQALLEKRQLLLMGKINDEKQEAMSSKLLYLNALSSESPITIFIDVAGGEVSGMLYICDAIRNSSAPVHGIVIAVAYSAGFQVLQACTRRSAYRHARLMFHPPLIGSRSVESTGLSKEILRMKNIYREQAKELASRSGRKLQEVLAWGRQNRYFDAPEALSHGLIDAINGK